MSRAKGRLQPLRSLLRPARASDGVFLPPKHPERLDGYSPMSLVLTRQTATPMPRMTRMQTTVDDHRCRIPPSQGIRGAGAPGGDVVGASGAPVRRLAGF